MKRFIHIPKTAGVAVQHWLCDVPEKVRCGDAIISPNTIPPKRLHKKGWLSEDSEKFTIVRNPYERLVSAYTFLIKENTRVPEDTSFQNFLYNYVLQKDIDTYRPQIWWLMTNKKTKAVDKIIRYENLEKELQEYFNFYQPLPVKNKTTYQDYNSYYNQKTRDVVYNFYKKDFDYLNYQK